MGAGQLRPLGGGTDDEDGGEREEAHAFVPHGDGQLGRDAPPKQKEKDLGERRLTNYSGVGISAGNELDIAAMVKGVAEGVEPEEVVAKAVHAQVVDEYRVLESMVYDEAFRTSSAEKERFVQPWKKNGAGEKRKKFLGLF